jgi:ribosomal protein L7/L12
MARPPLPADVVEALQRRRMVEAVKRLRQATGLGLAEAKALIEAHVRGDPAAPPVHEPHEWRKKTDDGRVLPQVVREALARGDRNGAIRLLRERTGLGVKEARRRIEAAAGTALAPAAPTETPRLAAPMAANEAPLQPRPGGLGAGEVPRSNAALWVVLLAAALLVAYFVFVAS